MKGRIITGPVSDPCRLFVNQDQARGIISGRDRNRNRNVQPGCVWLAPFLEFRFLSCGMQAKIGFLPVLYLCSSIRSKLI